MKIVWSNEIDNFLKNGILLSDIGVNNWALRKDEALVALEKFQELKVAILGGDICELKGGIIQYNYDSWYCEQLKEEPNEEFVLRSIQKAKTYIESYKVIEGHKIFFTFIPKV